MKPNRNDHLSVVQRVMAECAIRQVIDFPICTRAWADSVGAEPVICKTTGAASRQERVAHWACGNPQVCRCSRVGWNAHCRGGGGGQQTQDYTSEDADALSTLLNKMWRSCRGNAGTRTRDTRGTVTARRRKWKPLASWRRRSARFQQYPAGNGWYSGMLWIASRARRNHEFARKSPMAPNAPPC